MCVLEPRVSIEVCFGHVLSPECLVLYFAKSANLLQQLVQVFRQNLDHDLTSQFSIRLLFRICRRHIAVLFVCNGRDLLHSIVEADDLQFDSCVSNQFAVRQLWSGRFHRARFLCVTHHFRLAPAFLRGRFGLCRALARLM